MFDVVFMLCSTFRIRVSCSSHRTYHQFQPQYRKSRGQAAGLTLSQFEQSLATVRSFHLVLITEWLNSASKEIDDVLGWKEPPKRVS